MKLVQKAIAFVLIVGAATALSGLVFAYLASSLKSQSAPPKITTNPASPLASPFASPSSTSSPSPGLPIEPSTPGSPAPTGSTPNFPSGSPAPLPTGIPGIPPTSPGNAPVSVAKVEETLKGFFAQKTGVKIDAVSCPKTLQLKTGNSFTCEAKAENKTFPMNVNVRSEQGDFGVEVKGLLVLSKLEEQIASTIQQRTGVTVTTTCGESLRITKAGDAFECKVTSPQGQSQAVKVTVEDDQGRVRWRL
ncbi:MAG: DUF4333 domain-containing protein [Leptolyngbyaceae cyanobacterium bins.59]|nr:DUF4333 domain-containing protein [Leptolyngbyaceae cyanobacterium bins.59]